MDPLFSGSITRQRNINLGGAPSSLSSASQLAAQARASRQARDLLRQKEQSATTIQRVWRGSKARGEKRAYMEEQFRQLFYGPGGLSQAAAASSSPAASTSQSPYAASSTVATPSHGSVNLDSIDPPKAISTTAHLLEAVRTKSHSHSTRSSPIETKRESLLALWCEAVSASVSQASTPLLLALAQTQEGVKWQRLSSNVIDEIHGRLVHRAVHMDQNTKASFLAMYRALWYQRDFSTLERGHYDIIPSVIKSLPSTRDRKAASNPSFSDQVAALLLAPFTLLHAGQSSPANNETLRATCVATFCHRVLSIPLLPSRLALVSVAKIAATFPMEEVIAQMRSDLRQQPQPQHSDIHRLANILVLASQRVSRLRDGTSVSAYMETLTHLQDRIDKTALAAPRLPTGGGGVDQDTQKRLALLTSPKHIQALLAISAKFPSTTRPSLYAFLSSVLFSWPEETRTQVFQALLYSQGGDGGSGFVREIWRGYIRSSPIAKKIGQLSASSFDSSTFKAQTEGWSAFVLLAELYSRLLLTLGDDEFFPSSASASTSAGGSGAVLGTSGTAAPAAVQAARNPLSMDEVLSLTALVRNLAFALYWHVEPALDGHPTSSAPTTATVVPGLRLTLLGLRDSTTRLLQQVHARDARHRFTPEGYWLMTEELDLRSFIESVMMEEAKIAEDSARAEEEEARAAALSAAHGAELDEDDGYGQDAVMPSNGLRSTKRHLSARKLAFVSPRLGILNNLPFVIPFDARIRIFRTFVTADARRLNLQDFFYHRRRTVTIRRDHVAEDGMAQLNGLGAELKRGLEIKFIDQFGMEEAGIDGGGVFKEFLTTLTREVFDTDRGLWRATDQQEIFPNPQSYARQPEQLDWYAFVGRVLGKALYDGILVDVRFAPFFLGKWIGRRGLSHLDDLASLDSLDSELYRGLVYLKNYTGDVEQDLSLNFTVTDEEFGVRKVTELVSNGSDIPVTNKNRLKYIFLVANYRLEAQIRAQCAAFFNGLSELIDPRWLRIFDQMELQELIKGSDQPIDVADLRAHTALSDYHEKDVTITYLWEALESFDQPTRAQFLKFVTSCPSPPLLGFAQLNPSFCVRHSTDDEQRLPTSSTCVNLLKLPRYMSYEVLREKILMAIRSGAGFDLS